MGQENNIHIKVEFETEDMYVRHVHGLKLQQHYDWHHQFELRFPIETVEGSNEITLNQAQRYAGKKITIMIKSQDGNTTFNTFIGIITEVALTRHSGAASDLLFKGYSPTILLDDGPHCQGFMDKSMGSVIKEVLHRYPMNLINSQVQVSKDFQLGYILQFNESTFNFINRVSNDFGQWCYYNGRELIFGKLLENDSLVLSFGHGLSNFETTMRVLPLKFEGISYNTGQNQDYHINSDDFEVSGVDTLGKRAIDESMSTYSLKQHFTFQHSVASLSTLQDMVQARKSALAGDLVVVKGSSDQPALKIGTKVNIQGGRIGTFGSDTVDYGSYTIVRVSHFADGRGTYSNSFEAIPSSLTVPPFTDTARVPQVANQRAVVADNRDPNKLGRVKVRFPWQSDGGTTNWIRIQTAHAGDMYGHYWVPEIGDEVRVGFSGSNPSHPFVLGSFMNGAQNSSDRYDDNNDKKTIRTKSGNEILFNDKDGEETIHLYNKDKSNEILITMKNDGLIKIKSKNNIVISAAGNLNMSATNIKMTASKDMAIEVKENFTQTVEKKYDLKVMEDAEVMILKKLKQIVMEDATMDFTGKLDIVSMNDFNLSGLNLSASGMLNATLTAGVQLELSSSAVAKIQGALVTIN
ncbi:MAG: type VI secretion system Vgr family protein [Flavobacteriales bacterium]|jgi:type VI secretion system secreted protein VgrG